MAQQLEKMFLMGSLEIKDLFNQLVDGEYKIRVYHYDNEELGIHERRVHAINLSPEAQEYLKEWDGKSS